MSESTLPLFNAKALKCSARMKNQWRHSDFQCLIKRNLPPGIEYIERSVKLIDGQIRVESFKHGPAPEWGRDMKRFRIQNQIQVVLKACCCTIEVIQVRVVLAEYFIGLFQIFRGLVQAYFSNFIIKW